MDFLIIIEKQFNYAKNIIFERRTEFKKSFEEALFEGEETAAEVYIHGLTPLYKACLKILYPSIDESTIKLEQNIELPLVDQYIDLYAQVLNVLREIADKMSVEELNEHIIYPFNPDTTISRLEWIGLNIMHALTHVGQALRLQSLYLRMK